MRLIGKTASILLICAGLFAAWFASPALAAKRGNAADFAGVWDTVAASGAKFRLTLRIDATQANGVLVLSGEFKSKSNPEFNGTIGGTVDSNLDGTASGGKFTYYSYQPKVKVGGTGYFIVGDDDTIQGFFKIDGESKKYVWAGTRVSKAETPKPEPTEKGVRIEKDVTGYDAPGGNDKCYLSEGETAKVLGEQEGDPIWKHLQGIGACDGQDFWVYDDGVLKAL